jgi:hypothetical protein
MINNSEHQATFIEHLRALADDQLEPREAVQSYHAALERLKIQPYRSLKEDLRQTPRGSSYGSPDRKAVPAGANAAPASGLDGDESRRENRLRDPDFATMTTAEKLAWNQARWKRILG